MSSDMFQKIMRTQAEYARTIDDGRLEEWPAFFEDPCIYKITTASNVAKGYEAGIVFANSRGMLIDRITALREANIFERHTYRHISGAPCILSEGEEGTRSETPFMVVRIMRDGTTDVFASGCYRDLWRADGDQLKLAERFVVCDSSRIDTLLVIPL
jgi:anthranilate 1,2-dioxygenase small subunit